MHATHVQVLHDDGRWYLALLLAQHRSEGRWRAVVRYSVAAGMTYQRGVWADDLRPVVSAEDHHDQRNRDGAHGQSDGNDRPGHQIAWIAPHRGRT
jgi:hypothetical protein